MRATRKNTTPADTGLDPERELSYDIAQAVHDLRIQQGLSQAELAKITGTKQPAISRVESANNLPTLPLLLRLADGLGTRLVVTFEKPEGTPPA